MNDFALLGIQESFIVWKVMKTLMDAVDLQGTPLPEGKGAGPFPPTLSASHCGWKSSGELFAWPNNPASLIFVLLPALSASVEASVLQKEFIRELLSERASRTATPV